VLKNIDPRLNPDLLHALAQMGHGDMIVVGDANYPAATTAEYTTYGTVLRMDHISAAEAVEAILSVMPLDDTVDDFACRMQIDGDPERLPPVQAEVQNAIDAAEGRERPMLGVERHDFYDRAKSAFAVVLIGERRFFGSFLFRKGVIAPPAAM